MKAEDRALGFVTRADAALADPASSADSWADSIRSKTEERLLHVFPFAVDQAIRKVSGEYPVWNEADISTVQAVVECNSIKLFWVLSAHPSGWVREETVRQMENFDSERVAPHLANRTLDFIPAIRDVAQPMMRTILTEALTERQGGDPDDLLPTSVHIAVSKLMRPRAGLVCPELVQLGIALAKTAAADPPGRLRRGVDVDQALTPYRQLSKTAATVESREALEAIMGLMVS